MAIATGTATLIAAGVGVASSAFGAAQSFSQASKAKKLQKEAEAEGEKMMAEARKRLDVNYMDALSIQKEPYELQREAMLAQGAQATDAARESERGAAAAAGRVQMAQNEAQGAIRTEMGKELTEIERLKIAEESRLRDLKTQLDLSEAEGAALAARNYEEMRNQSISQGFEGLQSAATQGANLIPLYAKAFNADPNAGYTADPNAGKSALTNQGLQKNAVIGSSGQQLIGTGSNIQWNPTGAGMPTLNPNQQPQNQGFPLSYIVPYNTNPLNPFYR